MANTQSNPNFLPWPWHVSLSPLTESLKLQISLPKLTGETEVSQIRRNRARNTISNKHEGCSRQNPHEIKRIPFTLFQVFGNSKLSLPQMGRLQPSDCQFLLLLIRLDRATLCLMFFQSFHSRVCSNFTWAAVISNSTLCQERKEGQLSNTKMLKELWNEFFANFLLKTKNGWPCPLLWNMFSLGLSHVF